MGFSMCLQRPENSKYASVSLLCSHYKLYVPFWRRRMSLNLNMSKSIAYKYKIIIEYFLENDMYEMPF